MVLHVERRENEAEGSCQKSMLPLLLLLLLMMMNMMMMATMKIATMIMGMMLQPLDTLLSPLMALAKLVKWWGMPRCPCSNKASSEDRSRAT